MRLRAILLGTFILSILCGTPARSQEFRSTITGRVIDGQQAVVPGAKIICTNAGTGAKYETVSGADGLYTIPFVPPGQYSVGAEAQGFKAYLRKGIQVSTNERMQLDIVLELGQVTETVTVTAEAPMLEAGTASTGQVINSRQMENMPANGRTPLILAQLAAGVVPNSSPRFVRPFDNSGSSSFSMGGAPATTNELLINGAPDVGSGGAVAYNPPMDAVTELKVESFQADAAYGHTGGGTVNVLLKSGTNDLHGSAYEFNQTSALAATSWFLNSTKQKKNVTRYNQWGATSGGPVYIPKVFDGRNKLFFFFAYEGIRTGLPQPTAYTVPTDAERGGDLSALLKAGPQYQIYDPLTGVKQGSRIQRMVFPNNMIPSNRISPIAKNLMQYYAEPNSFTTADGTNDFISNEVAYDQFNNELANVDWNAGPRQKISFNFRHNDRFNSSGNPFNNIANFNRTHRINWGGGLDHLVTLSPTTLLNWRFSYTRYLRINVPGNTGFDITTAGFPESLAAASPAPRMPSISFSTFSPLAPESSTFDANDTYQIFAVLTKVMGNHSLKFGTDMRLYRNSSSSPGNSTGAYTFGTQWTVGPADNSSAAPIGQDWAAFLLGLPTAGSFDLNASSIYQAGYYSLFVQDDFRVRPDLTLNLGLRYERDLPTTERFNRTVNGFDFSTPNPINAAAAAAYAKNPISEIPAGQFQAIGGLLFAAPNDRYIYNTEANNFSPRFGFAWKPAALGGKTVVRGGFGMYYFPLGVVGLNQTGFSQSTSLVATNDGYLTPNATLSNPFPAGITQPVGSSAGLATFLGKSVSFYNPNPINPYSVRWTFNIQHQLPSGMAVEIGYEGNHAVHLTNSANLNYVPAQYLSRSPTRDQPVIDHLSSLVANPFAGLIPGSTINGSTIALSSLLTAYPEFTGVSETGLNEGSSYFHMGSVRLEKRFSGGFTLMANYQFSKILTRISRLNDSDVQLAKRVAAEDRPQRLTLNSSYELPFGRGKKFGSNMPALVNGVIGGWILNGIYQHQTGAVLSWGNVIYYGGDINLNPRVVTGAFDTTQFDRKSAEQLASNVRTFPLTFGDLHADGVNNLDLSVIKRFPIRERLNLQYRCEWFNALNHPVFSAPNTTPTSSAFATITSVDNLARVIQMGLRLAW
ncbi:MAG TPA: TonB-dependent receptor [Bryobacteraceae bacterium]|nr:TonB-dependent receptor [Bryobacteraceae bacterium]